MSDELQSRLAALDGPRPLSPALTARLERVLVAEAEGMADVAAADSPRPIPEAARDRMAETLVRVAVIRPLPTPLRNRLERTLVRPDRQNWRRAAVAAAVLFLVATTAAYVTEEDQRRFEPDGSGQSALGTAPDEHGAFLEQLDPEAGIIAGGANAGSGSSAPRVRAALPDRSAGVAYRDYPTPPYAYVETAFDDGSFGEPVELRDPPPRQPLRLGIIGGDDAQEAGFRAYVSLVNAQGGAGGHRLDVVPAGADGTVATVNLSRAAVADNAGAPLGTRTPLLESVDVVEPALRHTVFDVSSVPERQAHLAVAAALGDGGNGIRAVVYTAGAGPFRSRVPDALEQALRARGATVVRVRWDPGLHVRMADADVAFVSLPTEEARSWLRTAKTEAYRPTNGIWGVWSLADESLLADMPANVRMLSPYELQSGRELAELVDRTGRAPSARLVHGWVTAKWLAVSIWLSQADDNAELAEALADEGFDSGFAPMLEYRDGTHARLPEAIVLKPQDGHLVGEGDFLRDD